MILYNSKIIANASNLKEHTKYIETNIDISKKNYNLHLTQCYIS